MISMTVPSSSTPNFASYFNVDIRDVYVILHNIQLQFVTGSVIGTTGMTGYFNPCFHWINHIDIVMAGVIVSTIYGDQQFLHEPDARVR